jgi:hypothetical protein
MCKADVQKLELNGKAKPFLTTGGEAVANNNGLGCGYYAKVTQRKSIFPTDSASGSALEKNKKGNKLSLVPQTLLKVAPILTPERDCHRLLVAESVSAISRPALSTVACLRRCFRNQRRADSHQAASQPQSV